MNKLKLREILEFILDLIFGTKQELSVEEEAKVDKVQDKFKKFLKKTRGGK